MRAQNDSACESLRSLFSPPNHGSRPLFVPAPWPKTSYKKTLERYFGGTTVYCLLPTAFCPLPTAHCLLPYRVP